MDLREVVALLAAGGRGAINAAWPGTPDLPTPLAFGYPPVLATSPQHRPGPGSASGAWAYRPSWPAERSRVMRLAGCSVAGGIIGASCAGAAESAFDAIVPVLILLAVAL